MKDLIPDLSKESHKKSKYLKQFTNKRPGRLALKDPYLDLHKAIVAIATAGVEADSRRLMYP